MSNTDLRKILIVDFKINFSTRNSETYFKYVNNRL